MPWPLIAASDVRLVGDLLALLGLLGVVAAAAGLALDADGFSGNLLSEAAGLLIGASLIAYLVEVVRRAESWWRQRTETGFELAVRSWRILDAIERDALPEGQEVVSDEKVEHPEMISDVASSLARVLGDTEIAAPGNGSRDTLVGLRNLMDDNLHMIELHCLPVVGGRDLRSREAASERIGAVRHALAVEVGGTGALEESSRDSLVSVAELLDDLNRAAAARTPHLSAG